MHIICSDCEADLGEKEPLDRDDVTHTMCEVCFEHFDAQWGGMSLDRFLDRFDASVLVVDPDRRVVSTNAAMREMLGWDRRQLVGRRGGEVMECVHARPPAGRVRPAGALQGLHHPAVGDAHPANRRVP